MPRTLTRIAGFYHRVAIAIAITLIVVAGCLVWANSAWLLTPFWAWLRLNDLRSQMASVPTVPNTTLVERIEGMSPSGVYGCASVYVYELRGSNNLSLSDVYQEYYSSLPSEVQHTKVSSSAGNGYEWKKGVNLETSSFAAQRDILPFDSTRGEAAEQTYKTLFVVGLNQPVYPDNFDYRCH